MLESTLSRNLKTVSQLSIDDIVSFDYGGKKRKGPIVKITETLITVEVNDNNAKYKSFCFNRMESVITQHVEATNSEGKLIGVFNAIIR